MFWWNNSFAETGGNMSLDTLLGIAGTIIGVLGIVLVLQRDFRVLRDFGYYYETLRLRRLELGCGDRERVRLR